MGDVAITQAGVAVDTRHKLYDKWQPRWQKCRDAAAGEDEVKRAGEKYLPRPSGQNEKDYQNYKTRAYWFNATQRTVDGLTGLIFRKDPVITAPESIGSWQDDITLTGVSLLEFCEIFTDEVIHVGRAGILVDFPQVDLTPDLTVAQVEAIGARPFLALYEAEDIVNWRFARVGTQTRLVTVVLRENVEVQSEADEFVMQEVEQYRVLDLDASEATVRYRQRIYRKEKTQSGREDWVLKGETFPLFKGKPLEAVPFYFAGVSRSDGKIEAPPIYDLVNVNLSHYRTLADLEHLAHWTGLPTPVLIGLSEDKKEVPLGSTSAIILPQGGSAMMLEVNGGGQVLEKRAEAKENQMALLGARILAPEKKSTETAETAAIHRAGENSVLASIANVCSRQITAALKQAAEWGGADSTDVDVALNTDYLAMQMSPAMLLALTTAVQQGKISMPDYFDFLQRGNVIDSERTFEECMADIEQYSSMITQEPLPPAEPAGEKAPALAAGGGKGGGGLE